MWKIILFSVLSVSLSACSAVNSTLAEKTKEIEYYRIFDVKTEAGRSKVIRAASKGLSKNVPSPREAMPIPPFAVAPETPGRFKVVDAAKNLRGNFGALVAMGGGSFGLKTAQCDDAIWIAQARKTVKNSWALDLTSCLFEYQDGFHLDMYAHFTKEEGGLMQLSRSMANAMVGTPEEWVEKTFLDVVRTVNQQVDSDIKFIEGYPEVQGTPWLDTGDNLAKK